MEKADRDILVLTLLAAAAPLSVCGLLLADLAQNGTRPLTVSGAVLSLVGAALVALLMTAHQRRMVADQAEQDAAMDAQEKSHEQKMKLLRAAADQEMETFRSSLSHSLRMPVAIIQGYAELLSDNVVTNPDVRKEYLEKIVQRSQYMSDVMTRHFSSGKTIESDRLTYGDLDLLELVRRAATDMQTAAQEQGVTVQVLSPDDTMPVRADAYLLNRVMFNLLENALKYMGRPGVITVRILQRGEQVSILVQDDGMGLPAEETEHIFEANYQGSNHSGGSGFGLHLVKQAAEAHGGEVSAQSAPGRGMGITVTIPKRPAKEPASV